MLRIISPISLRKFFFMCNLPTHLEENVDIPDSFVSFSLSLRLYVDHIQYLSVRRQLAK